VKKKKKKEKKGHDKQKKHIHRFLWPRLVFICSASRVKKMEHVSKTGKPCGWLRKIKPLVLCFVSNKK